MKIGVISDTHDRLPTFRRAVEILLEQRVDVMLHAGDYVAPFAAKLIAPAVLPLPLHCIYGNNDGEKKGLRNVLPNLVDGPLPLEFEGKKLVMAHFIDWLTPADIAASDIIVTGHTHAVVNETCEGKLFLNPGECCGWLTGRCTVAILHPGQMRADVLDVPA